MGRCVQREAPLGKHARAVPNLSRRDRAGIALHDAAGKEVAQTDRAIDLRGLVEIPDRAGARRIRIADIPADRHEIPVRAGVHPGPLADLAELAGAVDPLRRLARLAQRRQEQPDEDGDDADDDQQLYERQAAITTTTATMAR